MNELVGSLNQLENQIIQLRKDRDKQKDLTRDREQTIFNFRRDVFLTVAMKEDKEFIKDLKKLNEVYVLGEDRTEPSSCMQSKKCWKTGACCRPDRGSKL